MITKKIDNIFDIVFSILLFSLTISTAIPNILLAVLFLIFLFKKDKIIFSNNYTKLILVFIGYIFLKAIFFNSFFENFNIYKHLLVISFLSFLSFNIKNITFVLKGYVLGVFLGVLISFFKILKFYFSFKTLPFGNTSEVQDLILIHRPYFGFMCLIAIVLVDVLLLKFKSKKGQVFYLIIAFFIIFFLYLIVARLALFLTFIYLIVRFISCLKFSRTKSIISIFSFVVVVASVFVMNKNIKDRLHIKNSYEETIKVLKNQEPRFVIWNCFLDQINKNDFNLFFGYNNRKMIQENLNKCYKNNINNVSKRDYYLETKFNTHSQFFDVFLDGGIIGCVLLLNIFLFLIYILRMNFHSIFIICSFFIFLLLENLFNRQLGVYLFGIFIPLFYKVLEKKNK